MIISVKGFTQIKIKAITKNNFGISAIREVELKKDLYAMASDHFRGREAGTLDELKDAMWWADQLKIAGLKPAGEDGTYFQFFSMQRKMVA